ncbi:hypothetical protein Bca52824_088789 [Brassica carinata]|uniref:Uncharacterized protein n=1 Tax=Brassica carinata TaxID=52824 RepID=A0A8X7PC26_BRACI|nr:hypothetical protein Bca52824_088789 [Brassica carinata]
MVSRLRGADMGPMYGFSPETFVTIPVSNDDFNNSRLIPIDPLHILVLLMRDGEDVAGTGTASVGLGQNLDEGERGEGLSPGKQTDSTDGVEFRAETGQHGEMLTLDMTP